ncbi:serine hydrolase domain-containing protein [Pontibacter flavimaris]|uniref:Beta-lactamase-related domain-containing protein n=1 Tax=Pontibacter flavimaris TaxID=1797110 RepID=A0A1Q5PD70_9BACT|nr:serine hydrolase domain-containing protein [Pontibacter flavimaris]OKL40133.1 hypothetical protein A3841_17455 [Pontibacter flavimaris]
MKQLILLAFLLISHIAYSQGEIESVIDAEYEAGRFNGALLAIKEGRVVAKINRGSANLQFTVPITDQTRIPIASMTKTFTAILTLQMHEKSFLKLEDKISKYVSDLPPGCQDITILALLTHSSGLKNEPLQAYTTRASTEDYLKKYVTRKDTGTVSSFNYNNVDYIVLSRILEIVSQKSYAELLRSNILQPLGMENTGVIVESEVIPNLAYGYHNYTFGSGSKQDTLYNDPLVYLSNYAGAGAVYSTTVDLNKLVQALKTNKLLSVKSKSSFLTKPQKSKFIEYARGYPTIGFYLNDKTFSKPVMERRGSINGFNSLLLMDKDFKNGVIILTNTDTGDLEEIGDKVYKELIRPTQPIVH